jgi:hypothetical protein
MSNAKFSESDFWRTVGELQRSIGLDLGIIIGAEKDIFNDKQILEIYQVIFLNVY